MRNLGLFEFWQFVSYSSVILFIFSNGNLNTKIIILIVFFGSEILKAFYRQREFNKYIENLKSGFEEHYNYKLKAAIADYKAERKAKAKTKALIMD